MQVNIADVAFICSETCFWNVLKKRRSAHCFPNVNYLLLSKAKTLVVQELAVTRCGNQPTAH